MRHKKAYVTKATNRNRKTGHGLAFPFFGFFLAIRGKESMRAAGAGFLTVWLILLCGLTAAAEPVKGEIPSKKPPVVLEDSDSYMSYSRTHGEKPAYSGEDIVIPADGSFTSDYTPEIWQDYGDRPGKSLLTQENGYVEWTVDAGAGGMFRIEIDYYPVEGKGSAIEREVLIDGKLPFREARSVLFSRVWIDVVSDGQLIRQDAGGNDIRPSQAEKPRWMKTVLRDAAGYGVDGLLFYLSPGTHTIRLKSVREPMLVASLTLCAPKPLPAYEAVREEGTTRGEPIVLRAEEPARKSDPTLIPVFDRSTPDVQPNDPVKLRLNCIGGDKWQTAGQWIEWDFEVPAAGYYKLGLHAVQNILNGSYSSRKIYIDGKVPFEQMNAVQFSYSTRWKTYILGGSESPFQFYFKQGRHTIRMEVTLADMADIVARVEETTNQLNQIYRSILVVTGPSPDVNRDYQFERILPDVLANMAVQAGELKECYDLITAKAGMKGESAQILRKMSVQLNEILRKPETIASRFSVFQANISSVGTWTLTAKQQPLNVDTLYIVPSDEDFPADGSSFLEGLSYHFNSFISSFWNDYNTLAAAENDRTVKVWVGSGLTGGRDQAQALKSIAENYFTPRTGIGVNMQLVAMGALLPATLSGKGPDIALSIGASDAVNYAVRRAVVNLAEFPDFSRIAERFSPGALTPLSFNGGVYGLPETQTWPMLFYRKDILSDLKLAVPDTWDDVIHMLPVLQKKQMNFGLPSTVTVGNGAVYPTFGMLLYQNGGHFYSEGGRSSTIDSRAGIDAFHFLTMLYSDYKLPVALDFVNRFRTGAIPIGIGDYSLYNQLSVFAPELNGLWDFALVPGRRQPDGSVDRSVCGSITTSIILKNAQASADAWEFVKWWTETGTQVQFGRELESIMGTAARYPTANTEALYQIPWSKKSFDILMEQWQYVKGIPEVPGGYYTSRYIDFAFRNVVYNSKDAGEELTLAARTIDAEIKVKRKEFKLPD